MVLTNAQTAAFFESATQMAMPPATAAKLREEGIDTAADLAEFDKTSIGQIADNLWRPGGRAADPNNAASAIPTPPFIFGAKSKDAHWCGHGRLSVVGDDDVLVHVPVQYL